MDIFKSKKFQVALAGVIVVIATAYMPEIDPEQLAGIVVIILGYILGQAAVDFSKEAKK